MADSNNHLAGRIPLPWEVDGDDVRIWFGDKGSDNFFEGRFAADGNLRRRIENRDARRALARNDL